MVVVVLVLRVVVIVITCASIFVSQESKLTDYTQFLFVLVSCGSWLGAQCFKTQKRTSKRGSNNLL